MSRGKSSLSLNVMRCAIYYHLHKLKNVKNTHGGVLLLVKLKAKACNSTKSNILPCMEAEILVLTKLFTSFIQKKIGYLKK